MDNLQQHQAFMAEIEQKFTKKKRGRPRGSVKPKRKLVGVSLSEAQIEALLNEFESATVGVRALINARYNVR